MTVLVCGPLFYHEAEGDKEKLLSVLSQNIGDSPARLLFISRGEFDIFAAECVKHYQSTHPATKLIFISPPPIVAHDYQTHHLELKNDLFDEIICPIDKNLPVGPARIFRDKWVVDESDFLIVCVPYIGGSAYKLCQYATRKHKKIINIAKESKLF